MPPPGWYRRCMAASSATATRRRPHRVAGMSRTHRKVSVKLPIELVDDIEDRVGPGNLSRYVAETVADSERRRALRELVDELELTHGPITEDDVQEELSRWDAEITVAGLPRPVLVLTSDPDDLGALTDEQKDVRVRAV